MKGVGKPRKSKHTNMEHIIIVHNAKLFLSLYHLYILIFNFIGIVFLWKHFAMSLSYSSTFVSHVLNIVHMSFLIMATALANSMDSLICVDHIHWYIWWYPGFAHFIYVACEVDPFR